MKNKVLSIVITLFVMLFALKTKAQTDVVVTFTDGTVEIFVVEESGKLYFSGSDLMIQETDGNIATIVLSDIRKINFYSDVATDEEVQQEAEASVLIYPNPSKSDIRIINSKSNFEVSIYSMQGSLLLKGIYSTGEAVNISHLMSGLYILKIDEKPFKICKL